MTIPRGGVNGAGRTKASSLNLTAVTSIKDGWAARYVAQHVSATLSAHFNSHARAAAASNGGPSGGDGSASILRRMEAANCRSDPDQGFVGATGKVSVVRRILVPFGVTTVGFGSSTRKAQPAGNADAGTVKTARPD